jgi:hypothetical protein
MIRECSIAARWLFIEALCYADEYTTGGKLTEATWRGLPSFKSARLKELQRERLIEEDLSIHDWEDWNEEGEKAKARRQRDAKRKRDARRTLRLPSAPASAPASADVRGPTPTPTPTPTSDSSRARSKERLRGTALWDPHGHNEERAEELMGSLELNAATRARIRKSGLDAVRIVGVLRDTIDKRPKRPGGYAWKLIQTELNGGI